MKITNTRYDLVFLDHKTLAFDRAYDRYITLLQLRSENIGDCNLYELEYYIEEYEEYINSVMDIPTIEVDDLYKLVR